VKISTNVPGAAILNSIHVPGTLSLSGISIGNADFNPAISPPQVTSVTPAALSNNAAQVLTVNGSGLTSDTLVRVGDLDVVQGTNATGSSIQVPIPAMAPAQPADIVVSKPNAGGQYYPSSILRGQFAIASSPNFHPNNQVLVGNFADGNVSILNMGTNAAETHSSFLAALANSLAISSDGSKAYIGSGSGQGISAPAAIGKLDIVNNIATTQGIPSLLTNGICACFDGIASAPTNPTNGNPAAFVTFISDDTSSDRAAVIDFTTDTLIGQPILAAPVIDGGGPSVIAATPDGAYAYSEFTLSDGGVNLYQFDVANRVANSISISQQLYPFPDSLVITQDGKYLFASCGTDPGNSFSDEICVWDITNRQNTSPTLITTYTAPPTVTAPWFPDGFRVVGTKLYTVDPNQNVLAIFNFDPTTAPPGQFKLLASFAIDPQGGAASLDVTPDGNLIYVSQTGANAAAVYDVNQALAGNPNPLVTKIGTGATPGTIRVRPGTPTQVNLPPGSIVTVQPIQQVQVSLTDPSSPTSSATTTVTVTNATPVSVPAGFALVGIPTYYEVSTTANFSNAVLTFSYDPTLTASQVSNLRVLHYNTTAGTWDDVTVDCGVSPACSLNTTNHTIQGTVMSFSPFTIGVGTPTFYFDSLLGKIASEVTQQGVMRGFRAKATAARAAFQRGDKATAKNQLNSLLADIQAQSGKAITSAQASDLAGEVQALLGSF
jgi:hypothetical protein